VTLECVTAPEAAPLEAGSTVAPRYDVLAHLCRTGWLDLYDVWSEERDCRCVVKTLRPSRSGEQRLRDRLLREGRWLESFTHPHLVRAYETIESPQPCVVLETLTGETLAQHIDRRRLRLPAREIAFLGLHLCSALHYLHGRNLLHLDIKPDNVVVDCRRAKLLDLSVARPPGPAPSGLGTFAYLAPEQARGGTLTPAADVWGLGITMYEAATGDVPFDIGETYGSGYVEVLPRTEETDRDDWYPQLEERAAPVGTHRHLPRGLRTVIDRCLEPDPDARPTVAELAASLDALLPMSRRDTPPPPPG
jgi:serine/threonine protein kinase